MTNYFICCEKCFEKIGKKSTRAARIWMDLCSMQLQFGEVLLFQNPDFPELRALERMGFVLSTDIEDKVAVKINGHIQSEEGEHMFCLLSGHHE